MSLSRGQCPATGTRVGCRREVCTQHACPVTGHAAAALGGTRGPGCLRAGTAGPGHLLARTREVELYRRTFPEPLCQDPR